MSIPLGTVVNTQSQKRVWLDIFKFTTETNHHNDSL